jgi:hypothetical protein
MTSSESCTRIGTSDAELQVRALLEVRVLERVLEGRFLWFLHLFPSHGIDCDVLRKLHTDRTIRRRVTSSSAFGSQGARTGPRRPIFVLFAPVSFSRHRL